MFLIFILVFFAANKNYFFSFFSWSQIYQQHLCRSTVHIENQSLCSFFFFFQFKQNHILQPSCFSWSFLSYKLFPVVQSKASKAFQQFYQCANMPIGQEMTEKYLGKKSREGTSVLEMSCSVKECGSYEKLFLWNPGVPTKIWKSGAAIHLSDSVSVTGPQPKTPCFLCSWDFGLFSSPQASKGWCGIAKV